MCISPKSGIWVGVNLRTYTKKDTCSKAIGIYIQNMLTILDSIVIISGGGGLVSPFNEYEKLHIEKKRYSFKLQKL